MILLKIENKTVLLKYTLLGHRFDYDLILYTLISKNNMQNVISIVDERTVSFKVDSSSKKSDVHFKNKFISSCINDYKKIIKNYYSKKKYLKHLFDRRN